MKQFIILMLAVALLIVGCKKVEVIEHQAQIERDRYIAVANIKGNTIYHVDGKYRTFYVMINDEDSTKFSLSVP
jgi:hypothetical protein